MIRPVDAAAKDSEEDSPAPINPGESVATAEVGAPIGPGEAEESAFLAEQRLSEPARPAGGAKNQADEVSVALPPMDDLIQRIPAATREAIDQLFRAKFITVKRLPASAFKTQIS